MTLLKRKRVLVAKIETTVGTAISVLAADAAFNAYDVLIQPEIEFNPREGQGGFGMLPGVMSGYKGKATFKTDAGWDGTVTEPTWADTFFPACGFVKTGQVFDPVTEAPGTNVKTLTIYCHQDGMIKGISGAVGNAKLVCPTGKPAFWEWDFTGVWIPPTDGALLTPTYPPALPLRFATTPCTFVTVPLQLENLTLDFGNEVVMREDPSTVGGFIAGIITNRNPKVTCNPESKLVATRNAYGQFLASTEGVLAWGLDGPTNSVMSFSAPRAQIAKVTEGDRNKLVTDEIEFQLNRNLSTVDRELSITFTAAV